MKFPSQTTFTGCGVIILFYMQAIMTNLKLNDEKITDAHLADLKFWLALQFLHNKLNSFTEHMIKKGA